MSREIQEVTHARLEPVIGGCPGLFTARSRRVGALDVMYHLGDATLRLSAVHRPRPVDLMVLVVLVALAGPAGRASDDGDRDRQLVAALALSAVDGVLIVETRVARVLHEMGLEDGGSGRAQLRESLARLAGLTVIGRRGSREASMHLLSYAVDDVSGALSVALSPRLTAAILGPRHIRLMLSELRPIREHARLLYVRICGWVDPGRTRAVRLSVLMGYLWPDPPTRQWEVRDRRRIVRRAMRELSQLYGWRVEADARGVQYRIARPGISPTPTGKTPTEAVKTLTLKSVISL
jgi:hypothetical protein